MAAFNSPAPRCNVTGCGTKYISCDCRKDMYEYCGAITIVRNPNPRLDEYDDEQDRTSPKDHLQQIKKQKQRRHWKRTQF